jgi:hypothetical protein
MLVIEQRAYEAIAYSLPRIADSLEQLVTILEQDRRPKEDTCAESSRQSS